MTTTSMTTSSVRLESVPIRIAIVGGGFAGIAAARSISALPNFHVTLLEASSRLGGRIHSVSCGLNPDSFAVELGATFLHGEEGNSLYELARDKQLVMKDCEIPSKQVQRTLHLLSNGEEIPSDEYERISDIFTDLSEEMILCSEKEDWSYVATSNSEWAKNGVIEPPSSVSEYIRSRFMSITSTCNSVKGDCQEYSTVSWRPIHILEHQLSMEALANASHADDIDVASYGDFEYPIGDELMHVRGGYENLVEELTKELMDKQCVLLNKEVTMIQLDAHESPVVLTCTDGTCYHADHVVVTVSLGVLKTVCFDKNAESLFFSPPLPTPKLDVIRKIGFGIVHKVALEFSHDLTTENCKAINLLWLDSDRKSMDGKGLFTLDRVGTTNIWVTWYVGQDAVAIQDIADDVLAENICCVLEKFLGHSVALPKNIWRKNWASDPHVLGSYSYNNIGTSRKDRIVLSEPVSMTSPLQVLFAGEATHPFLYSTTNGAYDSGLREANRLVKHYEK